MEEEMTKGQRRLSFALMLIVALIASSLAAQDATNPSPPLVQEMSQLRDSLTLRYSAAVGMDRAMLAYQLGVWVRDPESAGIRPWNDRAIALYDLAMMKRGRFSLSQDDYPSRLEGPDFITSPHWTKALRDLYSTLYAEKFDELGGTYWSHWPGLLDEIKELGKARLADRQHQLDTALVHYQKALALAEEDVLRGELMVGIADVLNRKQEHQAALDTLLSSVRNGGFSDDALFGMGRTLIYLGRIRDAIGLLQIVIEVNPHHEQAHYYLGNGYTSLNYNQIKDIYPEAFPSTKDQQNELNSAKSLMKSGFYPQAADSLMALRRAHASWIEPVTMLAEIAWLKGDMDLSEALCQEALTVIPSFGRAHAIYAKVQETRRLSMSQRRISYREFFLGQAMPEVPKIEEYVLNWDELTPRHQLTVALDLYPLRNFIPVLEETGSTLYIKPLHQLLSEAPFMTPLRDQRINLDSRLWDDVRGAGGFHTVTGIEDVERQLYGGYNTVIHEVTHQVHGLLTTPEKLRLQQAYQSAKAKAAKGEEIFMSRYQASTVWEYFAEGVNAYVSPQIDPWDEREIVRERSGRDTTLLAIVRNYMTISDMEPYYTEGHVNATYQDLEEGRAEHAWSRLQKIDSRFSNTRAVLAARSTVASLLDNDSLAAEAARSYIKGYPDEPDGYILLATTLEHAPVTKTESPASVLESALAIKTLRPRYSLQVTLARELQLAGSFTLAISYYDSALAVQADLPEALWGRAEAFADSAMISGNRSAIPFADSTYKTAVRLRSGVAELRLDYSRMLIEQGLLDDAEEQIREAEALNPRDPIAMTYRAWLKASRGDTTHAREIISEALLLDPVPDETRVIGAYLGIDSLPDLDLLLGEMAAETPRYVYNPRRYRYETRGELFPWYMTLLKGTMSQEPTE